MRIVVVDDHQILREVLEAACSWFGFSVVGAASTGIDAIETISRVSPDIVILDLLLPDMDGFAVADALRARACKARILAVSSRCDENTVYRIERAGFSGFLDKRATAIDDLRKALDSFQELQKAGRNNPHAFQKVLSRSQQVVLAMIGDLMGDYEVASQLGISHHTAEKHRFRIMRRLGIRSRDELLRYARKSGFTSYKTTEAVDSSCCRYPALQGNEIQFDSSSARRFDIGPGPNDGHPVTSCDAS